MQKEDLQSIHYIQDNEEKGLIALMSKYRESIFHFAYRYVRNYDDAAELTEETFVRVYSKARSYNAKSAVSTWIFAIAANLCRDFIRKHKKNFTALSIDAESSREFAYGSEFVGEDPDAVESIQSQEALKTIEKIIYELPHKLKFPFIFCILEEHTHLECADVLKTTTKTVELRIYRARAILKKKLTRACL